MFPTHSYNDQRQRGKEEHNVNQFFHSHLCLLFSREQLMPWLPRLNWLLVAAAAGCSLTGTSWSWGSSCRWWWWWGGGGPSYHDDRLKCDFQSLFHLSSIPQSSSSVASSQSTFRSQREIIGTQWPDWHSNSVWGLNFVNFSLKFYLRTFLQVAFTISAWRARITRSRR